MDKKVWRAFPEELYSKVMAHLPVKDVCRLRCVSKAWNSTQLDDSLSQKARGTRSLEFLDGVLHWRQLRNAYFACFSGDFLLLVDCKDDIFIMRPSELIFSQLPRLDAKSWQDSENRYVIGMVVHQAAKCFDVFVASHRHSDGAERVDVHLYNSSIRIWSFYGKDKFKSRFAQLGLGSWLTRSFDPVRELAGVVFHDNHYLMVVSKYEQMYENFGNMMYEIKYRYSESNSKWKSLRGELPAAGKMAPLLFDFKGRLMLAVLFSRYGSGTCSLWEYRKDNYEWTLLHKFDIYETENTGLVESAGLEDDPYYKGVYYAYATYHYAHVIGDFLYFGQTEFTKKKLGRWDYRMKYNLITQDLDTMSLDEEEVGKVFIECEPRPRHCYDVKRMFKRARDHRLLFCLLDPASVLT